MGDILNELLSEIESSEIDEQVKIICDKIIEEEKDEMTCPEFLLQGPNIFLCLDVPGRTPKERAWLALERESKGTYIARLWTQRKTHTLDKEGKPKESQVFPSEQWSVKEVTAKKIIKKYAERLHYLKGE